MERAQVSKGQLPIAAHPGLREVRTPDLCPKSPNLYMLVTNSLIRLESTAVVTLRCYFTTLRPRDP